MRIRDGSGLSPKGTFTQPPLRLREVSEEGTQRCIRQKIKKRPVRSFGYESCYNRNSIAGTGPIKSQLWVGEGLTGSLPASDRGREVTVHLSTINGLLI